MQFGHKNCKQVTEQKFHIFLKVLMVCGGVSLKMQNSMYNCFESSWFPSVSMMKLKVNRRAVSVVDLNTSQIRSNLIEIASQKQQQPQHYFLLVSTP